MLIVVIPPLVLTILMLLTLWYSLTKTRALSKVTGSDSGARRSLRNAGLTIMAAPGVALTALAIVSMFASQSFGGVVLVYATPFAAVFLLTLTRPLFGASLAVGLFVLFAVAAAGLIIFNYEGTAWLGAMIILFGIIWLIGAWTVIQSLHKTTKNPPPSAETSALH